MFTQVMMIFSGEEEISEGEVFEEKDMNKKLLSKVENVKEFS
jgi:hypothetical protein